MKLKFVLSLLLLTTFAQAQINQVVSTTYSNVIVLWPDGAPGALGKADKDIPTLTPFLPTPDKASGSALVICPGGGYGGLASHEGKDYALFFRDHGIACFVLKYRLGPSGYHHPAMMNDAARALRYVRANAATLNIDPKRIGIIGSSAGGHLAATAMTHFDAGQPDATDPIERVSARPDLGILVYPVITMGDKTHGGSRQNLLGDNPSPELIKLLSNELQVTKETPPTFLFHCVEDAVVPVENSIMFAEALKKAGVPFDLHIYEHGQHGIGLGHFVYAPYVPADPSKLHPWTADCLFWLKQNKFLK